VKTIKPTGERKLVPLEEAIRRVEGYTPEIETPEQVAIPNGFKHNGNLIERIPLTKDSKEHPEMTYDKSLERLQKAGFKRHLRPEEYLSVIMNYFNRKENGMKGLLKLSAEQMLHTESCWLSMACKREGFNVFLYEDPILKFDKSEHTYQLVECGDMASFILKGRAFNVIRHTKKLDSDLIEYLFSRENENFPKQMHEPHFQTAVEFPPAGLIWPLAYSMKLHDRWPLRIQVPSEARSRGINPI